MKLFFKDVIGGLAREAYSPMQRWSRLSSSDRGAFPQAKQTKASLAFLLLLLPDLFALLDET